MTEPEFQELIKKTIDHVKQTPEFSPDCDVCRWAQDKTTGETAFILFFRKLSVVEAQKVSKILNAVWDAFLP